MLERFFAISTDLQALATGEDPVWRQANASLENALGWHQDEIAGERVRRFVHADDLEAFDRALERARAQDDGAKVDLRVLKGAGGYVPVAWHIVAQDTDLLFVGRPVTAGTEADVRAGVRQLSATIEHQVRNHLAVIRALIRRMSAVPGYEEPLGLLQGRIDAVARVQAKLATAATRGGGVDLSLLIEDELVANSIREGDQLTVTGPELTLSRRAAEALSLAIHELAVNAIRFGAFCVPDGRVDISWHAEGRDAERTLHLTWSERGVPGTEKTIRTMGLGMETLLEALPYELNAETAVEFGPGGLRFTLTAPLDLIAPRSAGAS